MKKELKPGETFIKVDPFIREQFRINPNKTDYRLLSNGDTEITIRITALQQFELTKSLGYIPSEYKFEVILTTIKEIF